MHNNRAGYSMYNFILCMRINMSKLWMRLPIFCIELYIYIYITLAKSYKHLLHYNMLTVSAVFIFWCLKLHTCRFDRWDLGVWLTVVFLEPDAFSCCWEKKSIVTSFMCKWMNILTCWRINCLRRQQLKLYHMRSMRACNQFISQ